MVMGAAVLFAVTSVINHCAADPILPPFQLTLP